MKPVNLFPGHGHDGGNMAANTARLINYYVEGQKPDGRTGAILRPVPRQTQLVDLQLPLVRAIEEINGEIYVVAGSKLCLVSKTGDVSVLATVGDSEHVALFGVSNSICVIADGVFQVYDGSLSSVTGGYLTSAGSGAFFEYYALLTEKDGDYFEWTALNDPKTRSALNFKRNEARNDKTLRVLKDKTQAYFFGEQVIEVWSLSGLPNENAFDRRLATIEQGLLAPNLITTMDNGFFMVGSDKVPRIVLGVEGRKLVHPGVETALSESTPTHCFYYESRSHSFCVIRFDDRPAWVYDLLTGEWHERATDLGAWEIVGTCFAHGKWHGITNAGIVHTLSENGTETLVREAWSIPVYAGGFFTVAELEILGEVGKSDQTGMLYWSRDGSHTWAGPVEKSLGAAGDYNTLMRTHALGQFNQAAFKWRMSDAGNEAVYTRGNIRFG